MEENKDRVHEEVDEKSVEETDTKSNSEHTEKVKKNHVPKKEYDKLMEQFEKAMATAAHHQNLSKYYQNEYDKMMKYRSQHIIEDLLPSLDAFELAFKAVPNSQEAINYRAGFEYIYRMFMSTLENEGLAVITPKVNDEFSSDSMQVMDTIETDDENLSNKVAAVLLNGYKLKDRLIRAASVKVYTLKKEELKEEVKEEVSSNDNLN